MRITMLLGLIGGCILNSMAFASEQAGKVQSIQVLNDGRMLVQMQNARPGKPSCATYDYWLIADENSNAGKAQFSLILSAQASGRDVQLVGTGSCVRWVDGEGIASVKIL